MPAKRVIKGNKSPAGQLTVILWADVPAANQIAYRDPCKSSAYENITPVELQALRDGTVAERVIAYNAATDSQGTMHANLEAIWNRYQTEVTAEALWSDSGGHWTGASWVNSPGVPMSIQDKENGLPTFFCLTPVSAFGANKFHFVLFNNAATATSQGLLVKVRLLVVLPGQAAVTGAAPTAWTLRRRESPTTAPAGGAIVPAPTDSAHALPSTITAHNNPTTAPAGGTVAVFNEFVPQADEQKLSTLDAPTFAAIQKWGGLTIYNDMPGCRPLVLRPNQTLEVQQGATAGTGNARTLCVFTVG